MLVWRYIKRSFKKYSNEEKRLSAAIERIVGAKPFNLNLYRLALRHTSASVQSKQKRNFRLSNERLEYLGDAILGAIVADYLYKKFPFRDEGFLTEIRSRIVNRESLNSLAKKIGLLELILFEGSRNNRSHKSMSGDALEAFVGAIFLDKGFKFCQQVIIKRLIIPHMDIHKIIATNTNFKSIVIEWAQRENQDLHFKIISEKGNPQNKEFIAQITVNKEIISSGKGASKKKAEQAAAEKACEKLGLLYLDD
ncbi:MAG: ribonuclease III [Thermonemataceae bacterium]